MIAVRRARSDGVGRRLKGDVDVGGWKIDHLFGEKRINILTKQTHKPNEDNSIARYRETEFRVSRPKSAGAMGITRGHKRFDDDRTHTTCSPS